MYIRPLHVHMLEEERQRGLAAPRAMCSREHSSHVSIVIASFKS